jgi:hypothetical protein
LADRLETLGIRLTGTERSNELLDMAEAVDRFEAAVEAHGGDLMMDEGPRGRTSEPDDRTSRCRCVLSTSPSRAVPGAAGPRDGRGAPSSAESRLEEGQLYHTRKFCMALVT